MGLCTCQTGTRRCCVLGIGGLKDLPKATMFFFWNADHVLTRMYSGGMTCNEVESEGVVMHHFTQARK